VGSRLVDCAMARAIFSLFLLCLCSVCVWGHGWLTAPPGRTVATVNSVPPCEQIAPTVPPTTTVFIGVPFTVSWITPHIPQTQPVTFAFAPIAEEPTNLVPLGSAQYDDGSSSVTIPKSTKPGQYTFQWMQPSPGPYYNCVDMWVLENPPEGSVKLSGTVYRLKNDHGSFDASTGTITCDKGYHKSGSSCTKGLSGGAAFGIFLLVLVLVGLFGFIGVMIFLKIKKPEQYEHVTNKFKNLFKSGSS